MKTSILPAFTILSMLLASPIRADAPNDVRTENMDAEDSSLIQDSNEDAVSGDTTSEEGEEGVVQPITEDEGTSVGEASNEGASSAKKRMWKNIGLAVGAVAIAITALILVSSNDGHRHHKKS